MGPRYLSGAGTYLQLECYNSGLDWPTTLRLLQGSLTKKIIGLFGNLARQTSMLVPEMVCHHDDIPHRLNWHQLTENLNQIVVASKGAQYLVSNT